MANLNTKTIAVGVLDILAVDGGVTATPTVIKDGDGTSTSCKIATEKIVFQPPTADATTFLQVLDQDGGTPIFNIDSTNERVGIGTASPDYRLEVEGSANDATRVLAIKGTGDSGGASGGVLALICDDGAAMAIGKQIGSIEFYGAEAGSGALIAGAQINAVAEYAWTAGGTQKCGLGFVTNTGDDAAAERVRIDADGNVGIGTTDPGSKLQIDYTDTNNYVANATPSKHGLNITNQADVDAVGTLASAILFTAGDANAGRAAISCVRSGVALADLAFGSGTSGGGVTERMRIQSAGNVGIGDTTPECILDIAGDKSGLSQLVRIQGINLDGNSEYASFYASGNRSGGGSIRSAEIGITNNTAVAQTCGYIGLVSHDGVAAYIWLDEDDDLQVSNTAAHVGTTSGQEIHDDITASDERLKDISSDAFPYGLSDINKLIPIRFKYKNKAKNDWKLGLGAQTTQPIVPETVMDTDICIDGYEYDSEDHHKATPKSDNTKLRMSYSQFIPILIKAVQELSATVDILSTKVTTLENA